MTLAKAVFPECTFQVANALEFDYSRFDCVFYHVPFSNEMLLERLEQRILWQMPVGGVLLATRLTKTRDEWMSVSSDLVPKEHGLMELAIDAGRLRAIKKTSRGSRGTDFV